MDQTKETNIEDVIKNVRILGTRDTGYFDLHRKMSSDKGELIIYASGSALSKESRSSTRVVLDIRSFLLSGI